MVDRRRNSTYDFNTQGHGNNWRVNLPSKARPVEVRTPTALTAVFVDTKSIDVQMSRKVHVFVKMTSVVANPVLEVRGFIRHDTPTDWFLLSAFEAEPSDGASNDGEQTVYPLTIQLPAADNTADQLFVFEIPVDGAREFKAAVRIDSGTSAVVQMWLGKSS